MTNIDATLAAIDAALREPVLEAARERWWRFRCGEPCLHAYPYRCKRDLAHPSPHIALVGKEPIVWPGEGNAVSAQVGGNGHYKCWGGCRRIDARGSR